MNTTSKVRKIAFVGDHLPRKCGIATFTSDLIAAVASTHPQSQCLAVSVNDIPGGYEYPEVVRFEIEEQDLSSYLRAADFLNISNVDIVCLQHEFGIFGGPVGGASVREGKIVPPARHVYDERRYRWSGRGLDKVGMAAGSVALGVDLANGLNANARHVMQQKREILFEEGLGRAVAPHSPMVGDAALGRIGHDVTDSVNSGVLAGTAVGRVPVVGGKAHCPDTAQFALKGPHRILQGRVVRCCRVSGQGRGFRPHRTTRGRGRENGTRRTARLRRARG